MDEMAESSEYLRRNLHVAKAIGALASTDAALNRLRAMKRRPPQWLIASLSGIRERVAPLSRELAAYRDLKGPQ